MICFLLDDFSFIISKRLYLTSFKLIIINFLRALTSGLPMNSLKGSHCPQNPQLFFYLPIDLIGLAKTKSDFIVGSVETGLGK